VTPVSTYRLQCNREFTLDDAAALVPYFADLGIDWLYLSPIFAANPGSTHGYDVVDPTRINDELGGRGALERLRVATTAAGLRILLDIVPNHQAASDANPYWRRALEQRDPGWFDMWWDGDDLHYRRFFDVGELVAVRVEEQWVFDATHALIVELVGDELVDGLRVDHIDGLTDPEEYLERLREATNGAYVVVEKILARDETLPPTWSTAGTTGYEAGVALTEVLIEPEGRAALERALLRENEHLAFPAVERESKAFVLDHSFSHFF
jgi:(1->4)-alpha-D-glucan 1-alpha-D-glucosylmutase